MQKRAKKGKRQKEQRRRRQRSLSAAMAYLYINKKIKKEDIVQGSNCLKCSGNYSVMFQRL